MKHLMIDLEALDSNSTGVLVSLGAVYFDINTKELGDEFYMEVSKQGQKDQLEWGRTISLDTLQWWMQQSDNAREVFSSKLNQVNFETLLSEFSKFCKPKTRVWGNGADFDNVFLRSCYQSAGLKCPFSFRYNRCYRTIKNLYGHKAKLERIGTHHDGLDDSKTQALHLIRMLEKVNE